MSPSLGEGSPYEVAIREEMKSKFLKKQTFSIFEMHNFMVYKYRNLPSDKRNINHD